MRQKYLAAVSGGPDSMALLHKYHKQIKVVCSVDYNKRKNSHLDNELVEKFCKEHNIIYCLLKADKKLYEAYASEPNFQAQARKMRYDFFVKTAQAYHLDTLLVAHQLNDHLENAYMQQKRHSHALYYGIDNTSMYQGLKIIRPLLKYTKQELEDYCIKHKVPYAIDYTNALDVYERNQVRKIINNFSPEEYKAFVRSINQYNKAHKALRETTNKCFKEWKDKAFSYPYYLKLTDHELKYHLIYQLLSFHDLSHNSKNKIEHIIEFLDCGSKKQYRLENQLILKVENNKVIIK